MIYKEFEVQYHNVPFVPKSDIRANLFSEMADFVGNLSQLEEKRKELERMVTVKFREELQKQGDARNAIMRAFKKALEDEYAPDTLNSFQLENLFNYVWEQTTNLYEIECEYDATCNFLEIMNKAGNV